MPQPDATVIVVTERFRFHRAILACQSNMWMDWVLANREALGEVRLLFLSSPFHISTFSY